MEQQVAIITLGITDLNRSKQFYREGFGWEPVFEDNETVLYQMNGFVLGTWLQPALEKDIQKFGLTRNGAFTLAHTVATTDAVQGLLDKLVLAGGRLLRNADAPSHGGMRGYVADPDNHTWEILWSPVWKTDGRGGIVFAPTNAEAV